MKKRFLSAILALALCLGLCAVPALAVDVEYATRDHLKDTFTILRNGTVDETKGAYTSGKRVLLDLYYDWAAGGPTETTCEVYDKNDSWTITNTGSKSVSANGSTTYSLSFWYVQYGDDPWDGTDALAEIGGSGMLGLENGRPCFVYGDAPANPVSLEAGESVTIPAASLGEGVCELGISITYRSEDGEYADSASYTFYFKYDPAEKAAIEKNLGNKPAPSFTDVPDWCAQGVNWAVENKITEGVGNNRFSPGTPCTHAQILTFLWRAAGEPTPTATAPVRTASYYQDAVDWAFGEGLYGPDFDPAEGCTRAQAVNYIWLCSNTGDDVDVSDFTDVPPGAPYDWAINWAVAMGITNGYANGDGTYSFRPGKVCNRGEIATLLYRAYARLDGNP